MPRTEVITVFSEQAIAKNASVESDMISLRKFGPNSTFWGDFSASRPGKTTVTYKVGNTPNDTFYTPSVATPCLASFLGGGGANASRARFKLLIMGTPWIKFKANEGNASNTIFSMNLIVRQE